jgi:peptide/nickel transport system substrate-binding protein
VKHSPAGFLVGQRNPYSGEYGGLVPELADSWDVSADHLTWTFKLHPGIKWTDGTDFTSADVKFSFELCLDPKVGACYPGGSWGTIKGAADVKSGKTQDLVGVQAPDPLTVTITTDTPSALIPYLVQDLFILQKASVGAIPRDQLAKTPYWSTPGKVVGTGPFTVTGYSAGQSMEVSRNDNYWRGKPHLDKIIRKEFKDTGTALLAFDKGEVDVTYVTSDEVQRELQSTIGTVLPGPSGVDLDLVLNPTKNKDWADKRVRQAFLFAIDRESILKNVYHIADPVLLNCLFLNAAFNPPDVATYPYDPASKIPLPGVRRPSAGA